jgi:hypothetical protein
MKVQHVADPCFFLEIPTLRYYFASWLSRRFVRSGYIVLFQNLFLEIYCF